MYTVDERPNTHGTRLYASLWRLNAAAILLGLTSCAVASSDGSGPTLADTVSMCGHATVHYKDGRNIEWQGGRSLALCDWENIYTHEKGIATLGGFDINADSGVNNIPIDSDVNSKAWAGAVTNNVATTYPIHGMRMGRNLPVTVFGEATITPSGESEEIISGIRYVVKRYSDTAEAYSAIGHDTILSKVTLIQMPSGGYVPGARSFAPESHFVRVLVRPPEQIAVESISFKPN